MVSVSSNPDLKWNIVQQCTSCTQKSPEHNSACSLQRRRTHSCRSWDRPRCCRAARSRRCRWRPPCAPSPPPPARRPARPGAPWATGLGRRPRIYTQTCKRNRSCSGNKVFLLFSLALVPVPLFGTELPGVDGNDRQAKEEKNRSSHRCSPDDGRAANVPTGLNLRHESPALLYPAQVHDGVVKLWFGKIIPNGCVFIKPTGF